jgi:glycosyltransferase involved in cell wall biosynthesis
MPWLLPVGLSALTWWYCALIRRRGQAWQQLKVTTPTQIASPATAFSVLIAARDEARQLPALLADLAAQQYASTHFEILVVDDHSSDGTAACVEAFAASAPCPVRVLRLADYPAAGHGKKAAIALALAHARHDWVVCTDGDCRVGPQWLATFAAALHQNPALDLLSGPVALLPDGTAFARLQVVEFAGLVGVGAASLALGEPNMCNGANLAYRRTAWQAIGGFSQNQHIPSGDDEFLLHALWARRPGSAAFIKSDAAIVRTSAAPSIAAFLRQRVRWASKWRHYRQPGVQGLALGVFGLNLGLLIGLGWAWHWPATAPLIAVVWFAKLLVDAWFLRLILRFQGDERHAGRAVVGWQLLYIPYVVLTGVLALRGQYQWKGRAAR